MVFLWFSMVFLGFSMVFLWFSYDFPMVFPWFSLSYTTNTAETSGPRFFSLALPRSLRVKRSSTPTPHLGVLVTCFSTKQAPGSGKVALFFGNSVY